MVVLRPGYVRGMQYCLLNATSGDRSGFCTIVFLSVLVRHVQIHMGSVIPDPRYSQRMTKLPGSLLARGTLVGYLSNSILS
jgi:hypothetical protein